MDTAKLLTFSMALLIVQACSHPIEIVGQGDVTSQSGDRNCSLEQFTEGDDVCSKNYAIGAYQETFNPWPRAGWHFDHWGNYCADSTPPTYDCSFDYTAEQVRQFWFVTVPPLQAVFIPVPPPDQDWDGLDNDVDPCPANPTNPCALITDTITVNGRVWAQVDLFTNLSWTQINDVCPAGICKKGGILNGYDMGGWTWASIDDCNALFNTYVGLDVALGPGPASMLGDRSQWAPAFFAAGWRPTSESTPPTYLPRSREVAGVTHDIITQAGCYIGKRKVSNVAYGACYMVDYVTDVPILYAEDRFSTQYEYCFAPRTPSAGAWFYQ